MSEERGSGLAMVAMALAGLLVATMLLGAVGDRVIARAQAQSAADAAALAGAAEGRSGAMELARSNGAELIEFDQRGSVVRVVVEVRGAQAEAHAEMGLELGSKGGPIVGLAGPRLRVVWHQTT